ncbi:MAG: phosphohydrolase [Spirochaetes bacterium GWD1_27_9]|nr:MAG: phosphohydrolase [Spirochaetes bacterium GWC1_27_15]OHD30032.1 MAG: phosphohydrolase [Spirochaetes bacterium GWD1_27_9]
MLDQATLTKINRFIQNMPPLPTTVSKVLEIARNPKADAKELNNVISLDPVLTGKVLKLINSAYYSLPNQITSIVRAIIMLGINTVKNLVLSTAVISNVKNKNNFNSLDMEAFWRHSICVGVISKSFALKQNIDSKVVEEYFVAGLLHDIGKIPLNSVIPEDYLKAITYSHQNKVSLIDTETKMFDINHSDLGFRIAELWKLNKNLTDAIRYHHNIDEADAENKKFVATISLANIVTNSIEIGFSGDKHPEKKEEDIFNIIGLKWTDIYDAEETAANALKKAEIFLNIIE